MIYLALSILSSVTAALYLRRGEPSFAPSLPVSATGFLVAAAASAVWAVVDGQFVSFELPLMLFGIAAGLVFAFARFLLSRATDGGQLALPASLTRLAMLVPVLIGVIVFGEIGSPLAAAGLGAAALALVLLALGGSRVHREDGVQYSPAVTALILFAFALQYLSLQMFAAVYLGEAVALFLLIAFATAALTTGALALSQRQPLGEGDAVRGTISGVLTFAMTIFLLLAMGSMNGSQVFTVAAAGHIGLTALGERIAFSRPFNALGYVGLAAAAAGTALMLLG